MDHIRSATRVLTRALACALCSALLTGCTAEPSPDFAQTSLETLAAAWSAHRGDPICSDRGPRGEYLGPMPGAQFCQWPIVRRADLWSRVTGTQDGALGLTLITWERVTRDSAQLLAVTDSLERAFTAAGLRAYVCPGNGRRWQRAGLGVQLSALPPDQMQRPRLTVVATTMPAAIPRMFCPDAPELPSGGLRRTPRRRTA